MIITIIDNNIVQYNSVNNIEMVLTIARGNRVRARARARVRVRARERARALQTTIFAISRKCVFS